MTPDEAVMSARALVLHDLEVTRAVSPESVSALEEAVAARRWWASQWEQGKEYVAGLVAQDVQDAILDRVGRWPLCPVCEPVTPSGSEGPHALYIHPDLGGPDPTWVCESSGATVAHLGDLGVG